MATVIVSSSVWTRIYEFYDNVENRYRNTWDINDTLEQINKIKWVIQNFESICKWSRESIIPYWKQMEWRETWHKISPWHFAFEKQCVDNIDYIFIQDAEHQDDIHENFNKNKNIIIENKKSNTMKQVIRLTESDLHRMIKESVKRVLKENENNIEKSWWGITITYSDNMETSTRLKDVFSDEECIEFAQQRVLEDDSIKYIEAYRVDLPKGARSGNSTTLDIVKGENIKKNPFDDSNFREWYNKTSYEQD